MKLCTLLATFAVLIATANAAAVPPPSLRGPVDQPGPDGPKNGIPEEKGPIINGPNDGPKNDSPEMEGPGVGGPWDEHYHHHHRNHKDFLDKPAGPIPRLGGPADQPGPDFSKNDMPAKGHDDELQHRGHKDTLDDQDSVQNDGHWHHAEENSPSDKYDRPRRTEDKWNHEHEKKEEFKHHHGRKTWTRRVEATGSH
ncbi:hypothetical protein HDU79_001042 [Rhizoclosmatium sp. JEL0117]|nr:hypothetical protein HDU79_001042 [Rhizoclosmatium sp. JEL0117]